MILAKVFYSTNNFFIEIEISSIVWPERERYLVAFYWNSIDSSKLKFCTQLQSIVSQQIANKKRKIAANVAMEKQLSGLSPDMIMSFEELEYGMGGCQEL